MEMLARSGSEAARRRAADFLEIGIQRLMTFEGKEGGFGWHGGQPPSVTLTARALLMFSRIAKVHPLDAGVIERTRTHLLAKQRPDGSFREGGDDPVAVTAYVAWALAESGARSERAEGFVKARAKDDYSTAMAAMALAPEDPDLESMLDRLAREGWKAPARTLFWATGSGAEAEMTALAAMALSRLERHEESARAAVARLLESRLPGGTWGSTGPTLLALGALAAAWKVPEAGPASVRVRVNRQWRSVSLDRDVTAQIDLTELANRGENKIEIRGTGTGGMACQVVRRYALPWALVPKEPGPLALEVQYDRTIVPQDEIVQAKVRLKYRGADPTFMVVASLTVPPGFTMGEEPFRELVRRGVADRYEAGADRVTLYFGEVRPAQEISFSYPMVAAQPLQGMAPTSRAYLYYSPELRSESAPVALKVTARGPAGPVIRTER
jgi:hypothetical protein